MTVHPYQIVFRGTDDQRLTLEDLALHAAMHPAMVELLVEFGLVTPMRQEGANLFDPSAVSRLRTIGRLRRTLGINLAGISVILDLLDKIRALQRENENLRNRL
jgi:MerR family transcriptional regulator, heat shock protein HspR